MAGYDSADRPPDLPVAVPFIRRKSGVAIDLTKNVFPIHGADEAGKPALVRPAAPRAKLNELIASLPPCTVAIEARTGAHLWVRLFVERADLLNRPLRTRTVGGVGAGG